MNIGELLGRILRTEREYRAAMKEAQAQGGALVRQARKDLGLTQRELAEKVGVHYTYLSKVENGAQPPSRGLLAKLARLQAGVPVEDRRTLPGATSGTENHR